MNRRENVVVLKYTDRLVEIEKLNFCYFQHLLYFNDDVSRSCKGKVINIQSKAELPIWKIREERKTRELGQGN